MNLDESPEILFWPETHYVYVEKTGPFMTTAPEAWQTAHSLVPVLSEHNKITDCMSLYKGEAQIYRAGFALSEPPNNLPAGLQYEMFSGGRYTRFVLTGPYSNLPQANRRACEIVAEESIALRDDFNIEHYVNDPRTTPEEELVTEILFPTA
jgi:effector-binding domain-containing protein